ncbi:MAG: hypothetical protein IJ572_03390 [Bacilli bacterium]|nr:hypothetical protein [Bacilli bacterium]
MFIAHRGKVVNGVIENSLEAFKLAIDDIKYVGFECDVRETLDKEFVICHDAIYKNNIIKYQKLDKLKELGLTALDEVLSLNTSKIILLEIKDFNIDLKKLSEKLNNANKNIYVMSFSKEVIKKIKDYAINFKCGVLNYIFNSENNYSKYDFISLLNNTITNDLINYFNKKNVLIFSYGIINLEKINPNIYYIVDNDAKFMIKY